MNKSNAITSVMNTSVVTIAPQTNLFEVEQIFRQFPYDFIPVQQRNRLVGAIDRNDFVQYLNDLKMQGMQSGGTLAARSVEAIVNDNIIQLSTENTIQDAIEIFDTGLYRVIPILNAQDKLVGILTQQDLAEHVTDQAHWACASRA
ncbi:MAG: HPP family protein [Saprospiraceae bacterium]